MVCDLGQLKFQMSEKSQNGTGTGTLAVFHMKKGGNSTKVVS